MGLRALYFALACIMQLFHYMHYGLSLILTIIRVKLLLSDIYHIDMRYALLAVDGILAISITACLLFPKKENKLPQRLDIKNKGTEERLPKRRILV